MKISVMDSSIRDGGNVNDWKFGKKVIDEVVQNLVYAGVEYVELGYLKNCDYDTDRTLYNTVSDAKQKLPKDRGKTEFSLMVQEDKWNWDNLEPCDGSIKNIRVSFHKTDIAEGMDLCKKVMEMGYVCHCNPINIMGYNDAELIGLIERINSLMPDVFTIVDTFGAMTIEDMRRISRIIHNNLHEDITISAHLHENLGLAFSLAIEFIEYFQTRRKMIVDASLYGIGRVPGNLCIEQVVRYLIDEKHMNYEIDYIYDAIDDCIIKIKQQNPWGYEMAYALSGFYNLHRTYPEFLLNKGKLRTKDIRCILEQIDPEERVIYNEAYIEELYNNYMNQEIDARQSKKTLYEMVDQKEVVIVAPGRSLLQSKDKVIDLVSKDNVVSFSVNFVCDFAACNCIFFTNSKRVFQQRKYLSQTQHPIIIITSNLMTELPDADLCFNYKDAVEYGDVEMSEDSVLMLLHILSDCKPRKIYIAGFDSINGSEKHFDMGMELGYAHKVNYAKVREILHEYIKLPVECI
jgi:4-hydroxy 2-oxovalerate aldolase